MINLPETSQKLPLGTIIDFSQHWRDQWVYNKSRTIPKGAKVLDIGAGTCPYRKLFAHCDYKTHDFKKYTGPKLWGEMNYGEIDYVSDIIDIPVGDSSFDVIICTEVFEHIPEPILALKEIARIIKPGGRILLTAPLGSGLHQLPYHFYGGYTPEWYKHFAAKFGLEVKEITQNGGMFRFLSQESSRFASTFAQHEHLHGEYKETLKFLFGEWLPRYLFELDSKCFIEKYTDGYFVEFIKSNNGTPAAEEESQWGKTINHADASSLMDMSEKNFNEGKIDKARRLAQAAFAIDPKSTRSQLLLEKIK